MAINRQLYISVFFNRYLYTFSKNDVISSVQKHYCSLGLEYELCYIGNTFSVKRIFEKV